MDDIPGFLAANLRQLRQGRSLTQAQLATAAGVPRPTLAHLESGDANPTLQVLLKVAAALRVSVEELLARPRSAVRHYPADSLPSRSPGGARVRKILPDPLPGLEIERIALSPGQRMTGVPHTPGTREYLTCESGRLQLTASGERWELSPGDVVVFRGDQRHAYGALGEEEAVGYSVVVLGE